MNLLDPLDEAARLTKIARAALARWDGDFTELVLFKHRENAVFSVIRGDGTRLAQRVHRTGYHSDAALRSELFFMRELGRAGIAVPQVVAATDGSLFVHEGSRQIDMLGWLDGVPVKATADGHHYFRLGQLAARLHDAGAAIDLPADFDRHSWDEHGLLGEAPLWGRFLDLPALSRTQRDVLIVAAHRARSDLAAFGKPSDRYGLIHADLIRDNVIDDGARLQAIDFDDCGFGWYLFELATALNAALDDPAYPLLREQLLAGYCAVRPLRQADFAALPLFMFLRATTYLGWLQTRAETATAREKAAMHIARCCGLAQAYLDGARR